MSTGSKYAALGKLLEKFRLEAGIKHQAELAALINSTQQTVSRWELGFSRPREKQLRQIAQILKAKDLAGLFAAAGYGTTAMPTKSVGGLALDHPFPIDALTPDSFERFCYYFLAKVYSNGKVHRAGGSGHTQDGIDIEVALPGRKRYVFQCKRVDEFGPAKVDTAVRKCKLKATKKFILLSRVASPQTRMAIRKHGAAWDIWDKEDVSMRIRELPKEEQRRLVDIFFSGQRLALLGETEAGPWQSSEEFFSPFMNERGMFRHTWKLIGRLEETKQLVESLSDAALKVVLLTGSGGRGKTRILREAIDRFQKKSSGTLIRFLSPTSSVTEKSLEDLGSGPKILVVDDAHDRSDLPLLFHFVGRPESNAKLALSLRRYGFDYVKAQAGVFALSGNAVSEIKIPELTLEDATALAKEVLVTCKGPESLAGKIARVTRDCPLATVMAAQIVAKERDQLELTKNDDAFRNTLLGKFQDVLAGEIGDKADAKAIQDVLRVLAILQPFHTEDAMLHRIIKEVEGLDVPQINRLMRLLSEAGVLFRRGGQYRLSPDLLADFVIERACIGHDGNSTGYAEQVFDVAGGAYLEHLLVNLGRLDWRLANGKPSTSRLMDGLWAKLRQQPGSHLKAVAEVSYFQPERALDFAEELIADGNLGHDVSELLKYASYDFDCAPRACRLMWQVAKTTDASAAERCIKVLADLCAVEPNKPYEYNALVVEFALSLIDKEEAWNGKFTPLNILEGILRTEGDIHESVGRELRIKTYGVAPAFASPLRQKVVDATVNLLTHGDLKRSIMAAQFLKQAIHYPMRSGGARAEWTKEFIGTLEKIELTMAAECVEPLVIVELVRAVSWLANYAKDNASPVAARILASVPDSLEMRTTLALVDEYGHIFDRFEDYNKSDRERLQRIESLARDLAAKYSDATQLFNYIQRHLQRARIIYGDEKGWPVGLYWRLLESVPGLVEVATEGAIGQPEGIEIGYAAAPVAILLQKNRDAGIRAAKTFLDSGVNELQIAASRAYNSVDPSTFGVEDIAMVRRLLASTNVSVIHNALSIVRRIGKAKPQFAIGLLREVDFRGSSDVADWVLEQFGHWIPFNELSAEDVGGYLDKLMPIAELDGYRIDEFLRHASKVHAPVTAEFFMKRVEYSADREDWNFRPCNYGPWGHIGLAFREAKEFGDILRKVTTWMKSRDSEDYMFHEQAGHLFEAMFGFVDERILGFVSDWIDVAGPDELKSIRAILSKSAPGFIFEHRSMVTRLLDKAEGYGREALRSMISSLYGNAISGMKSGLPGQPFPQDVKMKEESEKATKEIPRFSAAYELYDFVRKHADDNIARSLQEAEMFEE